MVRQVAPLKPLKNLHFFVKKENAISQKTDEKGRKIKSEKLHGIDKNVTTKKTEMLPLNCYSWNFFLYSINALRIFNRGKN